MKTTTRAIAAIMLMFATVLTVGCKKENKCDCNITEGDWVDLGLPSGLLWATRNVGASSPTDYGSYYAWGETSPKSVYNWDTYRYARYIRYRYYDRDEDDYYYEEDLEMIKYNSSDGLTTLQPSDDAATANYGGRTPTSADWRELIDNTTNRWMTLKGVKGFCFKGRKGKCIFLPAAGSRVDENDDSHMSSRGWYWSSLRSDDPQYAKKFFLLGFGETGTSNFGDLDSDISHRYHGYSVRAVRQP